MFTQGLHAFTLAETPVYSDGSLTETYKKNGTIPLKTQRRKRGNVFALSFLLRKLDISYCVNCLTIKSPFTKMALISAIACRANAPVSTIVKSRLTGGVAWTRAT